MVASGRGTARDVVSRDAVSRDVVSGGMRGREADRREVIILSLGQADDQAGGGCGCGHRASETDACDTAAGTPNERSTPARVPVLVCRDALTAAGADTDIVTATSDLEIDAVIARLDGRPRPDGLTWPSGADDGPALVIAFDSDAQLRAVLRRMVRRWAPPPSRRPSDLPAHRTVPDLPPVGLLPLDTRGDSTNAVGDLVDRLGLPREPAEVAAAVLAGDVRRIDLFRTDAGSVTVHGALLGGVDSSGRAATWRGLVELDGKVLADGREPVLACAVANANGYARLDELELAPAADACSGSLTVAVAVPIRVGPRVSLRRGAANVGIEVRRATGRAVSVTPVADLPYVDDGVDATLSRKRAWWVEPGAWAAYAPR